MKKVLVVLMALVLVLGMTSMAFANGGWHKKGSPSQTNSAWIKQKVEISNTAIASTGNANAIGNVGITVISGNNSTAHACGGNATNDTGISVSNSGSAEAFSGAATVTSNNTNTVAQETAVTGTSTSSQTTTICE